MVGDPTQPPLPQPETLDSKMKDDPTLQAQVAETKLNAQRRATTAQVKASLAMVNKREKWY